MARVRIVLEVEGSEEDALHVVNELLDAGGLQDDINAHEFDAGPLLVTSALAEVAEPEPAEPVRVPRNARGIPLVAWPRLRDYDVALIVEHVFGSRLSAQREDGNVAAFSLFTDQHIDVELVDNGGELRVLRVDRTPFGPDVPLLYFGRPCGPLTLAYRIRGTIFGTPIDYDLDLDRTEKS